MWAAEAKMSKAIGTDSTTGDERSLLLALPSDSREQSRGGRRALAEEEQSQRAKTGRKREGWGPALAAKGFG
jgi:hypothetical protein